MEIVGKEKLIGMGNDERNGDDGAFRLASGKPRLANSNLSSPIYSFGARCLESVINKRKQITGYSCCLRNRLFSRSVLPHFDCEVEAHSRTLSMCVEWLLMVTHSPHIFCERCRMNGTIARTAGLDRCGALASLCATVLSHVSVR